MSELFDEREADAAVIAVLLKENTNLRRIINMSKIIVSTDGKVYRAEHFEVLSTEEVAELTAELKSQLSVLESAAPAAPIDTVIAPAEPAGPVEPTVTDVPAPVAPVVIPVNDVQPPVVLQ